MKPIWKTAVDLSSINQGHGKTIHDTLGIEITQIGADFIEGTLPVDHRTHQPRGLLHGGASAVLAESLGSIGSILVVGVEGKTCFGIELNLSHLRAVRAGKVTGRATPLRLGRSLHVWEIKMWETSDPEKKITCMARLTVMIREINSGS